MNYPRRVCAALVVCAVSASAHAWESEVVKTKSGCEISVPKMQSSPQLRFRLSYEWDGECVGGKAQGVGKLITRYQIEDKAPALYGISTQTRNAGIAFGYMTIKDISGLGLPPSMYFLFGDSQVSFTKGWGLSHDGLSVGGRSMALPRAIPFEVLPWMSIHADKYHIALLESACAAYRDKIEGCGADEAVNRKVYAITEGGIPEDGTMPPRAETLCPDPFSIASCATMLEQKSAPWREYIMLTLQRAKPDVDELLKKVSTAPPTAVTQPSAAAPEAQSASPADRGTSPLRPPGINVDSLPVGALFAAADQAIADGDKPGARAALRALIRRFPDHPLAAASARRMTELTTP